MNKTAWKSGQSIDNKYLVIKVPLISKIIEYVKTDSKGREKEVKIDRLATLLGQNGFGSFVLGQDDKGNNITIKLVINRVNPQSQDITSNSDFELVSE